MRLGGWIFVELTAGASLLVGLTFGMEAGARRLAQPTAAVYEPALTAAALGALETRPLSGLLPPRLNDARISYFQGIKDEVLLAPLRTEAIKSVRFNRGGSSISLRIEFVGGARAAFKPEQTNLQTIPRKEIAAYRLNRMLRLETVPPAIGRKLPRSELLAKLEPDSLDVVPRFLAEVVADEDGMVAGELSWWIPSIVDAKIDGFLIDSLDGTVTWRRYLQAGVAAPYEARHLLPQLSTMVAFDYLINNSDRWSGSNVKASPDGRVLFFMDNTLSFGPVLEGQSRVRAYLEKVQKFSRSFVGAVDALDEERLREAMTTDAEPYGQLLTDREIESVLYRRDKFLAYIDELVATYGRDQVLVFR